MLNPYNSVFPTDKAKVLVQALLLISPFFDSLWAVFRGGLLGYVVGLIFNDTFTEVLTAAGLPNLAVWQLGVILGFVGSFFIDLRSK